MHRWFFANDEIICESPKSPLSPSPSRISATSSILHVPETNWSFKVQFDWQLCCNEFLAISGNCATLGNWDVQASIPLESTRDSTSFWTLTLVLPCSVEIRYRYFVCAVDFRGRKFVRFWETHFGGRVISPNQLQIGNSDEYDTFGVLNNELKIERGWLASFATVVQLKFDQTSFVLDSCGEKKLLRVKVTPIKLRTAIKCRKTKNDDVLKPDAREYFKEESTGESFAFCEVASLQDQGDQFRKQTQYGTPCEPDHLLLFNITVNVLAQCAFLIDFYNIPEKSAQDVPPHRFGYQYIMPQDVENSGGTLDLSIICATRHRPMGNFKCDYVIVKPMEPSYRLNLEKTFQCYWNSKNQGFYCGHRGCGQSFWLQNNILRENCLKSFNLAIEHGADMIEFDVQLTKDLIPIVYHDTELRVSNNFDLDLRENDILHLPLTQTEIDALKSSLVKLDNELSVVALGQLTMEQLARVKVYEPSQMQSGNAGCVRDAASNRPFLTLKQVLSKINAKIGFVIDIKWPQAGDFDKNQYIDLILSVVLKQAGSRRIMFASNHADICSMVRLKQNLYPVMLESKLDFEEMCMDPVKTISSEVYFAHAMELWGIDLNCEHVTHIPGNIAGLHEKGLFVFCWGPSTRYENERKYLKTLGVDGIICDRLNHVLKPLDLKETFFYIVPFENSTEIPNVVE